MDDFRRAVNDHIGVGGWHCHCCGPTHNPRIRALEKARLRRWGRHRLKNEDRNRIEEELSWTEEDQAA